MTETTGFFNVRLLGELCELCVVSHISVSVPMELVVDNPCYFNTIRCTNSRAIITDLSIPCHEDVIV